MGKVTGIFLIVFMAIFCGSCKNSEVIDFDHPDVNLFVKQLKAGNYNTKSPEGFVEVPNFNKEHIPALLEYATDMSPIFMFPLPPISSHVVSDIKLGECMIWIVETIRIGDYASLGCRMVRANAENYEAQYFLSDQEILDAVAHYKAWWESNSLPKTRWSIDPCFDDPLCGTNYRWW